MLSTGMGIEWLQFHPMLLLLLPCILQPWNETREKPAVWDQR